MSVQFGVLSRRLPMDYGRKPHNEPMRFDVRMGVKTENAQCDHMFSALPLRTDIEQCSRHVRLVPTPEVGGKDFGVSQAAALSFSNAELFRRLRSRSPDAAC